MPALQGYTLYYKNNCPYSERVRRYMEGLHIACEMRDVEAPGVADELEAIGGRVQSPCLVHDGKAMYESEYIVEYLRDLAYRGFA
ncbi:glutaredoxin family protein [Curtanaerobium respiraculi]|uniref:glutaredoxin family protein n=1 Tax=Curtanaerobium respiraculi TaxID=2949669 RepID=UPI0024B35420|nr:glutathione S-transferase N-terminal domain-containing protein [Curtanaerobium respiraculi]